MTTLYELSDEELVNLDISNLETENEQVNEDTDENEHTNIQETVDSNEGDTVAQESDNTTGEVEATDDKDNSTTDELTDRADESSNEQTDGQDATDESTDNQDYQGFYETLTKPFKANGRQVQITNPDDMIALMQKGLNYSKKMSELKPKMNLVKTLEQYGLTDETKLSYLIDLHNKNPEAIARLVKDAGIDLYEFDVNQSDNYVTHNKVVTTSALEEVLNDLTHKDPSFGEFMEEVYQGWDMQSKEALIENPQLLQIFHEQKQSGLYDEVMGIVEYEKALGRLDNVPFLQAYSMVETQLLTNRQANPNNNNNTNNPSQAGFTAPRPKQTTKTVQGNKQKAANPTSTTASVNNTPNVLSMSDEELLEYFKSQQSF